MKKLTLQKLNILSLVGTWGYLSTRDISQLAWPSSSSRSAHVMAQVAASKLVEAGLLLARDPRQRQGARKALTKPVPKTGVAKAYVLTTRGAEILNEEWLSELVSAEVALGAKIAMPWFADGYNLSTADWNVRAPVIDLVQNLVAHWAVLDPLDPLGAAWLSLRAVGPRGAARNFLSLAGWSHFDAVLVNNRFEPVFGVYLAKPCTASATTDIAKLAKKNQPFLVACDRPARLSNLVEWRARVSPQLDAEVRATLPNQIVA